MTHILAMVQVASCWISDHTANYHMSKNGAYPSKNVKQNLPYGKVLVTRESYTDG